MAKKRYTKTTLILRWITRIWSTLAAAFILIMFLGEGMQDGLGPFLKLTSREILMTIAFFLVWLGLILGWWWETAAGLLTVGGMVAFYLLDYALSGTFPRGPFFAILAAPGVLYLISGLLKKTPHES